MQILSIRGKNIASLAQPFELRLDQAPLATAGLFAITGETGAGKSSLLDAMCLALYGDAPRLATGASSDEVPDPSGDAIKAKDARAILRRGAVQGWAEVRFTAMDGQDYIARWQARRARDKADGKLQNVSRSLARAADQQVLASQTTAVTEQIVALTGLTYEEFRRTVLLAQGDFDAFLRAAGKAGSNLNTDSFIKAMDGMTIPPDIFGSAEMTFTATKRLGSNASRLSQIQDGRWKVISEYVKIDTTAK